MYPSLFILHGLTIAALLAVVAPAAPAFEGRINAILHQGPESTPLLYTVGTNALRIEVGGTNSPNPVDIIDLRSGALTLLFPHNRSFVRVKAVAENSSAARPGAPATPMPPGGLPPGIGPRAQAATAPTVPTTPVMPTLPSGVGPPSQFSPGFSAMAMMPMPTRPGEKLELKATGDKTNTLGFACERYELKQRGETLEVWATDQLFPYQPYRQRQPRRFGPRRIDEQWPELLTSRKLFPLRAILRSDLGVERFRFEVKSVTPEKLTAADADLFQPPSDYHKIEPLPF